MKNILDLAPSEAKSFFLLGSSYFNGDFPKYISFEPIINKVAAELGQENFKSFGNKPNNYPNVNYSFVANKDGRFAWRPYELMHPIIYVSLVNTICRPENWYFIVKRFSAFSNGAVDCCSLPVLQVGRRTNQAAQIRSWWQNVEQQSIINSLTHTHMLQTDVVDCYGSIYTHSISWALHGSPKAKGGKKDNNLLGNQIDWHIQASRFGQTNGICQGSILMDFIAEIVLGYVDELISKEIDQQKDLKIVRPEFAECRKRLGKPA